MSNKVFDNETYEQQRINIELLAKKYPDDWFFKSQMELTAGRRTGFAPINRICPRCGRDITKCGGSEEWLSFISEYGSFYLPNFKQGTMYKGMKVGRKYTLEELGL